MIPALSRTELPKDIADLASALVAVREVADAAVAVHDHNLATRLVFLNLAEVTDKGLRGTTSLAALMQAHGAEIVEKLLCTEVPTIAAPDPETVEVLQPSVVFSAPPQHAEDSQEQVPSSEPLEAASPLAELSEGAVAALEHARLLRDTITQLTRELNEVLQPVTTDLLESASVEQLRISVPLYPASLQRNAILARLEAQPPGQG